MAPSANPLIRCQTPLQRIQGRVRSVMVRRECDALVSDTVRMLSPSSSKRWQLAIACVVTLGLLFQLEMHSSIPGLLLLLGVWLGVFVGSTILFLDALKARRRGAPSSHMWGALVLAVLLGPAIAYTQHAALWTAASLKLLRCESRRSEERR